jgi:hypothetical protein
MPEGQSKERTCDLRLELFRWGGVETWYDAKAGLRLRLVLTGHVDDPPFFHDGQDFSAPHFHGKRVRMEIFWPDPDWLEGIRARRGVSHACGQVSVKAGAEPKPFELDGKTHEIEPVTVVLAVSADAFEAIRRQAADDHGRMMRATVTLVGEPLPELDESRGTIWLNDLDVSVERHYAVGGFETSCAEGLPPRVLPVEPGPDEG